jgi:hypothetical protein
LLVLVKAVDSDHAFPVILSHRLACYLLGIAPESSPGNAIDKTQLGKAVVSQWKKNKVKKAVTIATRAGSFRCSWLQLYSEERMHELKALKNHSTSFCLESLQKIGRCMEDIDFSLLEDCFAAFRDKEIDDVAASYRGKWGSNRFNVLSNDDDDDDDEAHATDATSASREANTTETLRSPKRRRTHSTSTGPHEGTECKSPQHTATTSTPSSRRRRQPLTMRLLQRILLLTLRCCTKVDTLKTKCFVSLLTMIHLLCRTDRETLCSTQLAVAFLSQRSAVWEPHVHAQRAAQLMVN